MITKDRIHWICLILILLGEVLLGCQPSSGPLDIQDPTVTNTPITTIQEDRDSYLLDQPQDHEKDNQLKILFIANSYTFYNDLPQIFSELMASGGYPIDVGQAAQGGWSLSNHITSSATRNIITKGGWDFVVLQEQSVVNNPEGLEYDANLPPETAAKLQLIAAQTVLEDPDKWFLGK